VRRKRIGEGAVAMKTRTHFGHRIDMLDREGEIVEHLAGVEDSLLADATYEAALRRWPKVAIVLRQGARVIRDSRKREPRHAAPHRRGFGNPQGQGPAKPMRVQ
jgi:hypothetical protein